MLMAETQSPTISPSLLLGGSWDLAATYNWAHNPTQNLSKLHKDSKMDYK